MRALRLELLNFKSYKGAQTIGPFLHNFTAVIGPNGSGMYCVRILWGVSCAPARRERRMGAKVFPGSLLVTRARATATRTGRPSARRPATVGLSWLSRRTVERGWSAAFAFRVASGGRVAALRRVRVVPLALWRPDGCYALVGAR